jgi:carbonic anhydrase/acetyltransferase-like protein (isoleucine patch superfamily)
VTVGHRVILHGCTVGDRVLVGMGAIVLDNAVVERDVVIGRGLARAAARAAAGGLSVRGSPAKKVEALRSTPTRPAR